MKQPTPKVIEINVHRSRKNPRLGHAVALLFPCNHHKYLGLTLYKGEVNSIEYRTQTARVIKFEDFDILDKEHCKLCPQDEYWLDDLVSQPELDDLADVLESLEDI